MLDEMRDNQTIQIRYRFRFKDVKRGLFYRPSRSMNPCCMLQHAEFLLRSKPLNATQHRHRLPLAPAGASALRLCLERPMASRTMGSERTVFWTSHLRAATPTSRMASSSPANGASSNASIRSASTPSTFTCCSRASRPRRRRSSWSAAEPDA